MSGVNGVVEDRQADHDGANVVSVVSLGRLPLRRRLFDKRLRHMHMHMHTHAISTDLFISAWVNMRHVL